MDDATLRSLLLPEERKTIIETAERCLVARAPRGSHTVGIEAGQNEILRLKYEAKLSHRAIAGDCKVLSDSLLSFGIEQVSLINVKNHLHLVSHSKICAGINAGDNTILTGNQIKVNFIAH